MAPSVERIQHSGMLVVSDFITDGTDVWLDSMRFLGHTRAEAVRLFKAEVARQGRKIVN